LARAADPQTQWAIERLLRPLGTNPGTSADIQWYRCHEHHDTEAQAKPLCEIRDAKMQITDSAQDYSQRKSQHANSSQPAARFLIQFLSKKHSINSNNWFLPRLYEAAGLEFRLLE
jgi:hypothetical protein